MTKSKPHSSDKSKAKMSRRLVLGGVGIGALGTLGLSNLKSAAEYNPDKPQLLYEFSVDNFWYTKVDKDLMVINTALKGNHKADIVIIGGGFTGLSTAYQLLRKFPEKKIVVLEGAYCGYGASGRNGGHHSSDVGELMEYAKKFGLEQTEKSYEVADYGEKMIKSFVFDHGIECEYNEAGSLDLAYSEKQMEEFEKEKKGFALMGVDAEILQGESLAEQFNSPQVLGALKTPGGGRVNPAKLVRGMKKLVEGMGADIKEQTLVRRIRAGAIHEVETELGTIKAPILVLATNAYSHHLGFFKSGTLPVGAYNIATAPLSNNQLGDIAWRSGRSVSTAKDNSFNYLLMSEDNRIVIGGSEFPYYANDGLSSGNNRTVHGKLEKDLFAIFPQLEGLAIDYKWGGTVCMTRDRTPSVGVMGEHKNIYYGVGYNGSGVSFSHIAARIMADLIAGEKTAFSDYYLVNRPLPYLGPRSFRHLGFKLLSPYL